MYFHNVSDNFWHYSSPASQVKHRHKKTTTHFLSGKLFTGNLIGHDDGIIMEIQTPPWYNHGDTMV